MKPSEKQKAIFKYAKDKLKDLDKSSTGENYWTHSLKVAKEIEKAESLGGDIPLGIEIAILHDIVEETDTSEDDLSSLLLEAGYSDSESKNIIEGVDLLTDKKGGPGNERFYSADKTYLSVKYADMLQNMKGRQKKGKEKVEKYLNKKMDILKNARQGDFWLYTRCIVFVNKYHSF